MSYSRGCSSCDAVCVITSHWRSAYPTAAHERLAKAAGLPPAKVEYVEKQPTLQDVFLSLVGDHGEEQR